eukprot:2841326-Amphidinium_carterae.2
MLSQQLVETSAQAFAHDPSTVSSVANEEMVLGISYGMLKMIVNYCVLGRLACIPIRRPILLDVNKCEECFDRQLFEVIVKFGSGRVAFMSSGVAYSNRSKATLTTSS